MSFEATVSATMLFFTDFNAMYEENTCYGFWDESPVVWYEHLRIGERVTFTDGMGYYCEAHIVSIDWDLKMVDARLDRSTWRSERTLVWRS